MAQEKQDFYTLDSFLNIASPSVTHLEIYLNGRVADQESFQKFCSVLSKCKDLLILDLYLSFNEMSDESLNILSSTLQNFTNLESLILAL
ncbi:hypothetical protein ABPG72_020292, partial [Tetrahymena utriculariae]